MIVLDTNVVSELINTRPSEAVIRWFVGRPVADLFTTAITEAELLHGVALLPSGRRKRNLEATLERIFRLRFGERVLPFDSAAARNFGEIIAARRKHGRSSHYPDAQIAAIARSMGATVATRDVSDFEHCGIPLINPWTA
jgi:toxin FitB